MPEPRVFPADSPRAPLEFRTDVAGLVPPADFLSAAAELGIEFESGDVERLGKYLAMLLAANEVVNLTAVTDPAVGWTRHILDSLTLMAPLSEVAEGGTVIDVGSGGGLPGIPLACCMGHLKFTLLESTGKKAAFLRAACAAIGLKNVEVIAERAEVLGQDHKNHREMYDAVVARAVGPMSVIAELTVPLAKPETGVVLLVKGQKAEEELLAAKAVLHLLHAGHVGTIDTPTGKIVVLEKPRKTPRTYPRPAGEPKRRPLGA
jgi:16S rRNA (guanine527-N7)-methyltransferase